MAGRTRTAKFATPGPMEDALPKRSMLDRASRYLSKAGASTKERSRDDAEDSQVSMGCLGRLSRPVTAPARIAAKRAREAEARPRVQVVVRARPLSAREAGDQAAACVEVIGGREVHLHECGSARDVLRRHRLKQRRFAFDAALGGAASQEEVYAQSARPLVQSVLEGKGNATCFCYGATGTGKTFTMLGSREEPGVMVLSLKDLFEHVEQNADVQVSLSYLEIYNELVRDLLKPSAQTLDLREETRGPSAGVVVAGLTRLAADSTEQVMGLLQAGNAHRTTEPTKINAVSSRSHAILQIFVERQGGGVCKLSLIDLAGSERALATDTRSKRNTEGAHINKSLLALCECINALVQGKKHVPYRNSKLTQLLKDSLSGACKTAMIANISPAFSSFGESSNTLHWADRAKEIKTSAGEPAHQGVMSAAMAKSQASASVRADKLGEGGAGKEAPPRWRHTRAPAPAVSAAASSALKLEAVIAQLRSENQELKNDIAALQESDMQPCRRRRLRSDGVENEENERPSKMNIQNQAVACDLEAAIKEKEEKILTLERQVQELMERAAKAEASVGQSGRVDKSHEGETNEEKAARLEVELKQKDDLILALCRRNNIPVLDQPSACEGTVPIGVGFQSHALITPR